VVIAPAKRAKVNNPTEELRVGSTLSYLPKGGHLKCHLLEEIKVAEAELPEEADLLTTQSCWEGLPLTVKGAIQVRGVSLPVYVGFDSGDFLLVSAQR
jgi:hypothetical protein